ncbi:MAG: hypothetical protein MRJ68_15185 [Nitrospira sp.]|nr:hypothetical protein [Nitrospira sp.]
MAIEDRIYFDRDGVTITNRSIKTDRHTIAVEAIRHIEERFSLGAKTYYPILMVLGVIFLVAIIGSEGFTVSRCLPLVLAVSGAAFCIATGKQLIVQTDGGSVVVAKDKPWWVIQEIRLALEQCLFVKGQ